MNEDTSGGRRDLVARVAILELLVADLVDLLWRVNPEAMDTLAKEAARDLDIQNSRTNLTAAEHQRDRLYSVLNERKRKLQHRRGQPG